MDAVELPDSDPQSLHQTGLRLFRQGRLPEAAAHLQAAADAADTEGGLYRYEILNDLGVVYRVQRNWAAAAAALEAAAAGFALAGDVGRQGMALANLGDVYAGERQRQQAAACYSQAAALLAQAGDRARQSQVLRALSLHHLRQGHWWTAVTLMEQSLAQRPRLGLGGWLLRSLLRLALGLLSGGGRGGS